MKFFVQAYTPGDYLAVIIQAPWCKWSRVGHLHIANDNR